MVGHGSSDGPRVLELGAIPNLVPSDPKWRAICSLFAGSGRFKHGTKIFFEVQRSMR